LTVHRIATGTWGSLDWLRRLFFIKKTTPFRRDPALPLAVFGHSKSGEAPMYWARKFGCDYATGFCPAPSFKDPEEIACGKIYIDPDDPVPDLGKPILGHPYCETEYLADDPGRWKIGDHVIDHMIAYLATRQKS